MTASIRISDLAPVDSTGDTAPDGWLQPPITHYVFWETHGVVRAMIIGDYMSSAQHFPEPSSDVLDAELSAWLAAGEETLQHLDQLFS